MNSVTMLENQVKYINKAFWRNPASAFFTFSFPLMFLVIFTSLLGHHSIEIQPGHSVDISTYYVAAMAAYAVVTACYNNIAIGLAFQRDSGVLKRTRGTPIPSGIYILGRLLHALFVTVILVVITAAYGKLFYHATLPTGTALFEFLVMLIIGTLTFCALGFAITVVIPNADAAPAIVNASMLPLLFLSGIFIPITSTAPSWLIWIAKVFPVYHFAWGMKSGFLGTPFDWMHVIIVAAWGLGGFLISYRFFSWEPKR
jgi:ABC-2 type transport system permease protein